MSVSNPAGGSKDRRFCWSYKKYNTADSANEANTVVKFLWFIVGVWIGLL